ncbi:MAG: inositol monophosphatase family protein [Candidatus Micrarchaeota archaeon]
MQISSRNALATDSIRKELKTVFAKVHSYLRRRDFSNAVKLADNPRKDDVTLSFDAGAEKIIFRYFDRWASTHQLSIRFKSEEAGDFVTGSGTPALTLYIDPVDGSTNFKRGIESTAVSIAVIIGDKSIRPSSVDVALVGSIWSGRVHSAERDAGYFLYDPFIDREREIRTSGVASIEDALVGVDLDFRPAERWKLNRIQPILRQAGMIRRGGSAALDSVYVASGSYDACLDVRDVSTAENFIAVSLIVRRAGGVLTDAHGFDIPDASNLSKTFNWLASANQVLHEDILKRLDWET